MRITGGEFRGRTVKTPTSGALRPTQDRVRESLFNILSPEIKGAIFLDLFSGSGAVGIEAFSRGAEQVTFVDVDSRHVSSARANLSSISPTAKASFVRADVYAWIASYSGAGFTIVFADPPYALGEERGYAHFMATLAERGVVRQGGLFIAEMTAAQHAEETPGWDLLRDRKYGCTRICIWRRGDAPSA
jgi:16S rRNA (guanine966-N2)-methyltransferase